MHRITINCRSFLSLKPAGIGRYARNLVENLSFIDQNNEYSLYCRKNIVDPKRSLPQFSAKNFKVKMDALGLGVDFTVGRSDLYHSPTPEVIQSGAKKVIVTIHDLVYKIFPETHTPETIALSEAAMKSAVERATVLICGSEATRNDLERFFPETKGRTKVVYNGIDHKKFYHIHGGELSSAQDRLRALGIKDRFLLFVGTIEPRKNLSSLFRAFSSLKSSGSYEGKLVVAGMKGWMAEAVHADITTLGIQNDVILAGYLSDDELRCLYNLADVFVYPSLYEGFGFPVVEAMSCGTAVVTSRVSCLGEIAGGGALTIDPHSPSEIAASIKKILTDGPFRADLVRRGMVRAKEFSFQKNARETLDIYDKILNPRPPKSIQYEY
ncbi:MAG: glycosyltransferase family 4 protein [Candidatus Omnitrophica bacterium]|nr:glycosyltransferase family 4 protein [Candidatus Omnitrophota bacterium]